MAVASPGLKLIFSSYDPCLGSCTTSPGGIKALACGLNAYVTPSFMLLHYAGHSDLKVEDASIVRLKALVRIYHTCQDVFAQSQRGNGCHQPAVTCMRVFKIRKYTLNFAICSQHYKQNSAQQYQLHINEKLTKNVMSENWCMPEPVRHLSPSGNFSSSVYMGLNKTGVIFTAWDYYNLGLFLQVS